MKLVFLLEEPSSKHLLDILLPKILPNGVEFQTIPHRGKQDLQRSIPHKLRGWNEPGDIRFVILEDQDARDCIKLKQELLSLCESTGKRVLVRIACQEMESWYFGDVSALAIAYNNPKLRSLSQKENTVFPTVFHRQKKSYIPLFRSISRLREPKELHRIWILNTTHRKVLTSL